MAANALLKCSLIRVGVNICRTLQPTHAVSLHSQEKSEAQVTFFNLENEPLFNDNYRSWIYFLYDIYFPLFDRSDFSCFPSTVVSLKSQAVATKSWTTEPMRSPPQFKGAHKSNQHWRQVGTEWLSDAVCSSTKHLNAWCSHNWHHVGHPRSK